MNQFGDSHAQRDVIDWTPTERPRASCSVLGAIYLTAYLGGAVATNFRVGSPLATHVLFPVYVAAFVWGGLAQRNPRLLALLTGAGRRAPRLNR